MPHVVSFKETPTYDGTIDFNTIESLVYKLGNFYAQVGLTDEIQRACFVVLLPTKQAGLWLRTSGFDLNQTKRLMLKVYFCNYFQPSDFKHYKWNELAAMK